ncbi:MAG: cadherin repeat domain-containing protein [Defluviicoccus sp.]|nr:cadherin repeat domain-containing protein [Defluviicoccus sp.]
MPLRLAAAAIALACVSATGALEIRDAAAQDNAAPTFSGGSETRRYVGEETASGGAFGAPVSATDPDGDTIQYTLGGTDAALFAIDSATGQLRTAATTTLEYETRNAYDVEVSASDDRGGTAAVSVDIRVLDSFMVLVPTPTVRKRLRVTASVARIDEGGTVTFTVQSSRAAPAGGLRVAYSLKQLALAEGADAYDFRPLPNLNTHHRGTVTIAESATSASVTYRTVADDFDETDVVLIFDIGPSAHNNFSGQPCNLTNSLDVSTIAARPAGCWARVDVRDLGSSAPPESVPFTRYASVFAGHTSAFGGSNVQRLTPGDPLEFTVSLNVPAPRGGLVVHYGVNEKGSDVSPDIVQYPNIDRRSVTIPEGETERFVTIELGDRDPLVQGCADGGQTAAGCIRVTILSPSFVAVGDRYYLPYEHYPSSSRYYIDSILPRAATIAPRTSPIVEGGAARFTVTLFETAPAGGLNVSVRLSQEGDFATTPLPETRVVSVAGGAATGSTRVPTANDRNDEPDGKIVAQLQAAGGYTVGDPGAAEVVVRDNDTTLVMLSADTSPIAEGQTAGFIVRRSQAAPSGGLAVRVELSQKGDFAASSLPEMRLVKLAGGTMAATLKVPTVDDAVDEAHGKIVARAERMRAYAVDNAGAAEVSVLDDDDRRRNSTARIVEQTVPRVGRAIAGTVTRAVDCERHDRFLHDRAAIGGVDVRPVPAAREAARAMGGRPVDPWSRDGRRHGFGMSAGQALRNSSFALGSADRQGGDGEAYWGETAIAGFSGRADTVSMDGSVVSGMWGAERIADNRRSGLAFAVSRGKVAYGLPRFGSGEFRSSLASVHPYMCWYPSGDTSLWGMVGAGLGQASLTGAARVDNLGLVMRMVAGGLTRTLREDSKHALRLRVSAVGVSLRSRKSGALPRIKSTVVGVRKTVESSWKRRFESGALLRLSLEVGGRFDAGDAENGVGLLTGAGLRFAAGENRGFAVEATGHRLVKHTDSSFRDWGGKLRLGYSRRRLGGDLSLGLDLVRGLPRAAARRDLEADAFAPAGSGVASHADGWAGLSARYARPVLRSTGTLSLHGGVSWRRRGSRAYSAGLGLTLKEGIEIGLGGRFEDAPDGERAANLRLSLAR